MTNNTEQQAVPVAQEWVRVPREPTDAMVNACQDNLYSQNPSWNDPREIWSAMLATAPAHPCKSGEGAGEIIAQEAVDIITDLVGPQAAQSGTNCRVVEDHLRQLVRNLARREGHNA